MYGLQGSPPHTRGKDKSRFIHGNRCRITPAHAGKRLENRGLICGGEDHPRTRGEKSYCAQARQFCTGSPPHARGKVKQNVFTSVEVRITPARAGKRSRSASMSKSIEDHPRTRGEKRFRIASNCVRKGSPPHARGKALPVLRCQHRTLITPARAGKSGSGTSYTARNQDHPRTRGEKGKESYFRIASRGSPPHARGKVKRIRKYNSAIGITPARAGKSSLSAANGFCSPDHPRTRGEKNHQ